MRVLTALFLALFALGARAQTVAFTFDDGPRLKETPRMTPAQRNEALLAALERHGVRAALFVTVSNGADRPEGLALARAWGEAGHAVGNHTVTHPNLHSDKVTLAQYQQELLDCDAVIRKLPGYRKWFRFTFLREGNTPDKRDGMRAFLRAQGYRNGHVTIDTSDWRLDQKLEETLKANPRADLEPIRKTYLSHIRQRAAAYRGLARELLGRDAPHVLLLHHNLLNALWLDDVIAQFKNDGWTIASPEAVLADPLYQSEPDRQVAGQSLVLSLARSQGMGKFAGWERLVDDGDAEIEALRSAGY